VKRRIEPEQLNELTPEQKERLRELWKPQEFDVCLFAAEICAIDVVRENYEIHERIDTWFWFVDCEGRPVTKDDCLPLLDIGQMIELLRKISFNAIESLDYSGAIQSEKLCDALWQAVKSVL
jgi:hypothetical protein